jgi:hypothetical protein
LCGIKNNIFYLPVFEETASVTLLILRHACMRSGQKIWPLHHDLQIFRHTYMNSNENVSQKSSFWSRQDLILSRIMVTVCTTWCNIKKTAFHPQSILTFHRILGINNDYFPEEH